MEQCSLRKLLLKREPVTSWELGQKLLIKRMAQPFAMQFCIFNPNKRKKPLFEAKKSMTKRGSAKSSFLRAIQFRRELV